MIGKSNKKKKKKLNRNGSHSSSNRAKSTKRPTSSRIAQPRERRLRDTDIRDLEDEREVRIRSSNNRKAGKRVNRGREEDIYNEYDETNGKKSRVVKGRTKEDVKRNFKRLFVLIGIIVVILLIMYIVSLFKWYGIMKYAIRCENSVILDSEENDTADGTDISADSAYGIEGTENASNPGTADGTQPERNRNDRLIILIAIGAGSVATIAVIVLSLRKKEQEEKNRKH